MAVRLRIAPGFDALPDDMAGTFGIEEPRGLRICSTRIYSHSLSSAAVSAREIWFEGEPRKLRLPPDIEKRLAGESFENLP